MDNQLIVICVTYVLTIVLFIYTLRQSNKLSYRNGYDKGNLEAKKICAEELGKLKNDLQKIINRWSSECTVTSTED